jgi:hypothetical protein
MSTKEIKEVRVVTWFIKGKPAVLCVRLKAVVFDLDGTLVDSKIDYECMAGMIRSVLSTAGISKEYLTDRRKIYQGRTSTPALAGITRA